MKETGILFTPENIRAIRDGRKTQTRRVIKDQPPANCSYLTSSSAYSDGIDRWGWTDGSTRDYAWHPWIGDEPAWQTCPYGQPGDRLYVKESVIVRASIPQLCGYYVDGARATEPWEKRRTARFMAKRYARTWLEITEVRVQRLQEISEEDAKAEGLSRCPSWRQKWMCSGLDEVNEDPRVVFRALWDSINAKKHPWSSNPWVWCIGFQRIQAR